MIRKAFTPHTPAPEPQSGKPEISGEEWLGRKPSAQNAQAGRRLWERLNPLHRKQLRLLAQAFVLRQSSGKLPEHVRARLHAALEEIERLAARIERLLAELGAHRPPPPPV
jgi:hypothetical protein